MTNNMDISKLLDMISVAVSRIENNCEEKQGVGEYCLYDDVLEIEGSIDQIREMLDK